MDERFLGTVRAAVHAEWVARALRGRSVRLLDRDAILVGDAELATAVADRAWEIVRCAVPPTCRLRNDAACGGCRR
jgi:hypothetical protein